VAITTAKIAPGRISLKNFQALLGPSVIGDPEIGLAVAVAVATRDMMVNPLMTAHLAVTALLGEVGVRLREG
jgi:hypothetical protein